MNPRALLAKILVVKTNKKLQLGVGGVLVVTIALFAGMKIGARDGTKVETHAQAEGHAKHEEHAKNEEHAERAPAQSAEHETGEAPKKPTLWDTYTQAWTRIQDRAEVLKNADEENERLRLENANLRLGLATVQFDCKAGDASSHSHDFGL